MNLREMRPLNSSVPLSNALSLCILSCYQICFAGTIKATTEGSVLNAQGSHVDEKSCGYCLVAGNTCFPG